MIFLKGTLIDCKSRRSSIKDLRDNVGKEITVIVEEKNDNLMGAFDSDRVFNETDLVLRIKPILK